MNKQQFKNSLRWSWYLLMSLLAVLTPKRLQAQTTYATTDTAYVKAVERALIDLKKGDCQSCLRNYQRAFAISQKSAMSMLRAAACAVQCQQAALAKQYIQQAVAVDYYAAEDVWTDLSSYPEFDAVRKTAMRDYVDQAFSRQDSLLHINYALKRELQAIYDADQQPRLPIPDIQKTYGADSPQMKQLWQKISRIDSVNLIKVERILQQYGYPGKSMVGEKQGGTAWLVIQHSNLATMEKYLPMMQEAAQKGELDKQSLALLIDRVRMYKGQKQLYGSQVTMGPDGKNMFHPIEDEVNVNKRRAEMGMSPIEEYARGFGFEYVPPKR